MAKRETFLKETKTLETQLRKEFEFADNPALLSILDAGMRAHTLMLRCEKKIGDSLTVETRYDVKAHPLLSVQRDARAQFLAAMKALNLEGAETRPPGRPFGT